MLRGRASRKGVMDGKRWGQKHWLGRCRLDRAGRGQDVFVFNFMTNDVFLQVFFFNLMSNDVSLEFVFFLPFSL